ncbi:hypothetical protein D3C72_555680 [compost metagenome]
MISAVRPSSEPSVSRASSIAALEVDTAPWEISVSVRARLPAIRAKRNSESMIAPVVRCSWAAAWASLTCLRIWLSPTIWLSRPAATRKRWRTASSPARNWK